jgi:chorismate lyase / 3-hydroxybenzoate synthase
MRKTSLEQFLWDTIALCSPVAERMVGAHLLTGAHAAANYSYRRTTMTGDGYIMVGDAFAFIDPVFSSGVHLALNSAMLGAKVVDAYLRNAPEYAQHRRAFERSVRRGIKIYSWFIYRFTQPAFRNLFMSTRSMFKMEEAVLSVLAGDTFGKSKTRIPIFLFKVAYYLVYLFNLKENLLAYRRRVMGIPSEVTEVEDYAVNSVSRVQNQPPTVKDYDLRTRYVEVARLESFLEASQPSVLGLVLYDGNPPKESGLSAYPMVCLDLPQFNEPVLAEVWTSTLPVRYHQVKGIQLAMNEEVLFGALRLEEDSERPMDLLTYTAYRCLLLQCRDLGYPHLLRAWNYFPHINRESNGLERYQRFCVGRYQALAEGLSDFPLSLPAGTTVGTVSGPLQILFLAARRSGTHIENPRQMSAYEYPRAYGPCSPSFARSTLRQSRFGTQLFIAGTASVVGHASRHVGEPQKQTLETVHNLTALITHTEQLYTIAKNEPDRQTLFKVYIRKPEHLSTISAVLKKELPLGAQVLYLQGEICRSELLVEIEGIRQ